MKKKKSLAGGGGGGGSKSRNCRRIRNNVRDPDRVNELLKLCLQKVIELQDDIMRKDEEEEDPEAAGYAACVTETVRFLSSQGLPPDHPVVRALTERLMQKRD